MKIRLSLIFITLSVFFLSCSNGISQKGEGYVTVDLNEFVQRISSRSAVSGQPVDVTLWTEGDYQTSVTQTVTDNGSEPIILDNIPVNSSISINIEAAIGRKNYLGASEKIVVQKGKNSVTIRLTKTVPTTDIVLYNQTSNGYSYYLANSDGSNINSPSLFFEPGNGPADFCFDADGNIYLSTNIDFNYFFFYNGATKANNGKIQVLNSDNEDPQIPEGKIAYDFAKRQVWEVSSGRCYKFSALTQSDSEWFDYKTRATVYNYRTTDLGVSEYDYVKSACVNDDVAYIVFELSGDEPPFLLAEYDISRAEVDQENEEEFSIGMPRKTLPLCGEMNMSYYAEISDMLYQDGAVYILLRETNTENTGVTSHGAILKYDVASETVTKLVGLAPETSLSEFDAACYANGYGMVLKSQNDNDYYIDHFTDPYTIKAPYKEGVNSSFVGPDKFVAIKPKKLVISDNGLAFYTNSITGLTKKKINRVIEIDLAALSVENANKVDVEYEFRSSYTSANISGITIEKNFSTGDNHYYYKSYQSDEYLELRTANQQLTATIIEE